MFFKKREYNLSEKTKQAQSDWQSLFVLPFYVFGFAIVILGFYYLNRKFGTPYYVLGIILVAITTLIIIRDTRRNKRKEEKKL